MILFHLPHQFWATTCRKTDRGRPSSQQLSAEYGSQRWRLQEFWVLIPAPLKQYLSTRKQRKEADLALFIRCPWRCLASYARVTQPQTAPEIPLVFTLPSWGKWSSDRFSAPYKVTLWITRLPHGLQTIWSQTLCTHVPWRVPFQVDKLFHSEGGFQKHLEKTKPTCCCLFWMELVLTAFAF